jgi:lysophospholipase L1-like esterase
MNGDRRGWRTAARYAAYGSGGAALAGAFLSGVLAGQAALARRTIPRAEAPPPRGAGLFGAGHGGTPLVLAMLGDSTAAGYGVTKPRQTPGALLASGLSARLRRPVRVYNLAVVGSTSAMLGPQVEAALKVHPDLAVILVGANDVTHRAPPGSAVPHLAAAVRALRAAGAEVVVGTCPDLGTIQPIARPLRWFCRRWSREMAAAQAVAVVRAGGAAVSLGDLVGPVFAASPHRMFGLDGFHPSYEGYGAAAAAVLPTLVAVLTRQPAGRPALTQDGELRPLRDAAAQAAREPGTSVIGSEVTAGDRNPARPWVRLHRRVRAAIRPTDPVPSTEGDVAPVESPV